MKRIFSAGIPIIDDFINKQIDEVYPLENGLYAKTDLTEYFAEFNARKVAKNITPDDNPFSCFFNKILESHGISTFREFTSSYYCKHPEGYNLQKELENSTLGLKIVNLLRFVPNVPFITRQLIKKDLLDEVEKILKFDIDYTNGDIFHGDVETLIKNSCSLYY